ncbi:MAG: tetratricopeptide repeat protein, partial [Saprospiraceae bacterium]
NRTGAIEEFNRGLELKPNHVTGYLNRSVIYNQLGDYPNALKDIETYFTYNPYNADLWYEAGRLKRALNRLPEAIKDYTEAIRLNGKKGVFYYERSRTQSQLNQIYAAKRDLAKAIQLGYAKIDPEYRTQMGM